MNFILSLQVEAKKLMHNFKNSAAVTKIKAIYSKRITPKQLKDLSNCKSVPEIASYLKNRTNYSNFLKEVDENSIHRGELEILIKKQNFSNYEKILHYFDSADETIFKIILNEFEVLEILKIILLLKTNNIHEYITYLPGYLISKCKIDLLKLAKIKNFFDLLDVLKNTWYFKILKKFKSDNLSENITFDYSACEQLIFEQFFSHVLKFIDKKMNRLETIQLKKIIKLEIYYMNICKIFRERIIFNSDVNQTKQQVLFFNKTLLKKEFQNLVYSKNVGDFKMNLQKCFNNFNKKNHNFEFLKTKNSYIENYFAKLKNKNFEHLLHLSNSVSVVFYVFHKLTQIEISNLIYTIEGVRYGLSPKKIQTLHII